MKRVGSKNKVVLLLISWYEYTFRNFVSVRQEVVAVETKACEKMSTPCKKYPWGAGIHAISRLFFLRIMREASAPDSEMAIAEQRQFQERRAMIRQRLRQYHSFFLPTAGSCLLRTGTTHFFEKTKWP